MQASNLLYVDQPTGTGFSYSTDSRDIRHDESGVSDDLYDFLQVINISVMHDGYTESCLKHFMLGYLVIYTHQCYIVNG